MFQRMIAIGRLTKDPELKYTPSGKAIATCSLAVDRPGSRENPKTDFFNLEVWEKQGEMFASWMAKGRLVMIEGRIQIDAYDVEGEKGKKYYTKFVVNTFRALDSRKDAKGGSANAGTEDDTDPFGEH